MASRAPGLCAVALAMTASIAGCGTAVEQRAAATVKSTAGPARAKARAHRRVELEIAVSGDLLAHAPVYQRARANGGGTSFDFRPMFRFIRPLIAGADLAICHVETPIDAGAPHGYPVFNAPAGLARAIRATGWDVCDTASNHSLDRGQAGVDATGRALARNHVRHTGSFRSAAARRRPLIVKVKGVRVAFLAYTQITNGIPLPHPWSVNLASAARVIADARRARRRGARIVIVNVHWGDEYRHQPSAFQRDLARRIARSRLVTAVVGQHVHVVQPIHRVGRTPVVFGEGNLLSNQTAACCPAASQDGLIALLHIELTRRGPHVKRIDYVPTWVRHPDYAVLPIGLALRRHLADAAALRASYRRTSAVVGRSRLVRAVPRGL